MTQLTFEWSKGTDSKTYEDALKLRHDVFVEEQSWNKEDEVDGQDDNCHHLVGYLDGEAVVTSRLHPEVGDNQTYGIQRVATAEQARGSGFGNDILAEIKRYAQDELKIKRLEMDAQDHAIDFYKKNGFQISDEEGFDFLGIPHHKMHIDLN